jgi:hypothetical protein
MTGLHSPHPRYKAARVRAHPGSILLLLAAIARAFACPLVTHLSFPDVYAALRSRVSCVGSDCPPTVTPSACMHHPLMRRILSWSADSGVPTLDPASASVLWNAT